MAARIQEYIQQLSSDLTKDERKTQRDAREVELRQGIEAARRMHDKADSVERGAIIGGVLTMVSAAGQFEATTEFRTSVSDVPHPGSEAELTAINGKANARSDGFGKLASLGNLVSQGFNAEGEREDGLSQEAQVRSRAAGRQADEASANLDAIQKVEDSAKDLLKEIAQEQHSSVMTILARQ
jgi:hypothetical protein